MKQHDGVVVLLTDFNQSEGNNILFNQFTIKMRNTEHKRIPFSMKFEEIGIIKPAETNYSFKLPSDVKISHSHHCICVADTCNDQLELFDLTSFKFLAKFPSSFVTSLFIEENYDNQGNDAIYFGQNSNCFKYRVKDLLDGMENNVEYLWKISSNHQHRMAMRKVGSKKELFRFDSEDKVMNIIDTENGNIRELKFPGLLSVMPLLFISPTRLIVADISKSQCFIFDEINENEWKLFKTIEQAGGIKFSQPVGLAIDRKGEKIFLSDTNNKRIVVFNLEGDVVRSYRSNSMKFYPYGLDFDDRNGLLYVTDLLDKSIRIFK